MFEKDTLKTKLDVLEIYTEALKPVLTGEIEAESIDSIQEGIRQEIIDESKLNATKEDSLYREEIERENRFAIQNTGSNVKIVFFAPLSGTVSQKFDANSKHFAVDIVAKTGTLTINGEINVTGKRLRRKLIPP